MVQLTASTKDFEDALKEAASKIQEFSRKIDHLVVMWAKQYWLEHHKRLPGSMRTARLRKKRKMKVLQFYFAHHECPNNLTIEDSQV